MKRILLLASGFFILNNNAIAQGRPMPVPSTPTAAPTYKTIEQKMAEEKIAQEKIMEERKKFPNKYNDPLNAVVRKLNNGLTFYLSVNKDEPRVQTYIAVKAGSKFDPADNTGLAHYLEHMMFKGTHKYGTNNWEQEKILLDKISALYEKHKAEKDPEKKKAIYKEIDLASYEASKLAVPNEYDKMISSLGAKGTNAYTSNDQTVYVNDIPGNELEKWMMVESERFQTLVLRLFHTELEAVYEEFNISQDNDGRWAYANLMKALYPNHPYGTQTTIGEGEHLKNPSMVNIHNYYNQYYVPNNIAICIAGDIDIDKTSEMIERYFGKWASKEIKPFVKAKLPEIKAPLTTENFGPQEEFVYVGYRMPEATNKEILKLKLIDQILSNGKAGLIDIDIMQKQQLLSAYSSIDVKHDFSTHILYGKPRQGQSLDDVKGILLKEIEKIKKGDFEDWMIYAAMNDLKVQQLKSLEVNRNRAGAFVEAFTLGYEWRDYITQLDEMKTITKKDIIDFAKKYYGENYAVSYKRKGENKPYKVDKPKITPVVLNRDMSSAFAKNFFGIVSKDIEPEFIELNAFMRSASVTDRAMMYFVHNNENELARYTMIVEGGTDNDPMLALVGEYLNYMGTDKLSAEEFKKELFKLGLTISYGVSRDRTTVSLFGLEENMEQGIQMMNAHLNTCVVNQQAYLDLIKDISKQRQNMKTEKNSILRGMVNYAKFGEVNPMKNIVPEEVMNSTDPQTLVTMIHSLINNATKFFYYGKKDIRSIFHQMSADQKMRANLGTIKSDRNYTMASGKEFRQLDNDNKTVLFYNYPGMVQAQIMMLSKGEELNRENLPFSSLFGDYFGGGLSSIVFQEIREQKALAYSAYAAYTTPDKKGDNHFLQAFVGTQADKMETAMNEMLKLLNKMPRVERQFESAKSSAIKQLAAERITKENIFWRQYALNRMGFEKDFRDEIYYKLKGTDMNQFEAAFNKNIANKMYTYVVMGDKTKINMEALKKIGTVKEMDSKDVFGY